jgi:hypothetical protein
MFPAQLQIQVTGRVENKDMNGAMPQSQTVNCPSGRLTDETVMPVKDFQNFLLFVHSQA